MRNNINKSNITWQDRAIMFLMILFPILIYSRYIFGDVYYFIMDDSFNQLYPNLYRMAEKVWSGNIALWDFSIGVGVDYALYYLDPFKWLTIIAGPKYVAEGMIFAQCVKLFLITLCSYFYARNFVKNKWLCLLFAICTCCSGSTLAKGMYSAYTKITACLMLMLCLFEYCYKKGRWWWMACSIVITELSLGYYYTILLLGILVLYTCGRFYMDNLSWKECFLNGRRILIPVILGIVMISPILFESLSLLFESSRMSESLSSLATEDFSVELAKKSVVVSTFLRTLSPDLQGISSSYVGALNYIDGPCFYVGLMAILIILQELFFSRGRKRILYFIVMFLSAIYILFPQLTKLTAGNASYTFKMSGIIVTFVLLFIFLNGIETVFIYKKINKPILIMSYCVIQLLEIWCWYKGKIGDVNLFISVNLFLLIYVVVLMCKHFQKNVVLVVLVMLETFIMTYGNVNPPDAITKVDAETKYYNDGTIEVVNRIKEYEKSKFFRVEKTYRSVGYADSLVQGYYGTKSYIGGNNVPADYEMLLKNLGMPLSNNDPRWVIGFKGYPQVTSLFGVKYMISNQNIYSEYGYELIDEYNDKYIYRNKYALPFGTLYEESCTYEAFSKIDETDIKRKALLKYCVMESGEKSDINGVGQYEKSLIPLQEYTTNENTIFIEAIEENNTLCLEVRVGCMDRSENLHLVTQPTKNMDGTILTIRYVDSDSGSVLDSQTVSIYEGENSYFVESSMIGIDTIQLEFLDPELARIVNAECKVYDSMEYYKEYVELCNYQQANDYDITKFKEDEIVGTVDAKKKSMLVLSMLYDENWTCYVDGTEVPVQKVNFCLLGVELEEGYHEVEFRFRQ